ncbi:MAG: hypothetical protein A2289_23335 [Deltaproteobacteria bacterium RIFOXYA12_FULL_58_15]|nr:MAG: hypothetical protein A2289_23335 [Deltaproteobacteria bacterium RIFOXYA12_FULL_58_15]OGR13313.1 MAG: hypothetical protein A2341_16160 [Deltaproteobacteria bacterium RIFOXYB12_FULL_58_9]
MSTAVLTVRVESSVAKRLARLAKATQRSKSYLAAEAIDEYLAIQEWQVDAIKKGLAEAARGEGVAIGDVKRAWEQKLADPSHS